jgi:hypothetical protein
MVTIVAMDLLEARIGLCATCEFRRTVEAARSTFYMCERSFTDPRFPKYPPIPVIRCVGYRSKADTEPSVD